MVRRDGSDHYEPISWDGAFDLVAEHLDAGADHVAVQALQVDKRGVPEDQWRALAEPLTALTR
ncbi:hypothetical protein [Pseudonocardia xishanensis]|uniref:Uncharacterized protein n=1 Tax=Pseudonocardia xishanensis TaxID=630995 RepID=A0ABP8RTW7_9PSEU